MALEATHIKFAIDIKDKFNISEIDKYVSGTIYPDSRYLTKIDRKLCHHDGVLDTSFFDTDFKKGWSVHFLCDKLQNKAMDVLVADLLRGLDGDHAWGTEWWIAKTAMKNIVDMNIFPLFDIHPYLKMLEYAENPNGEPIDLVRRYNDIMVKLYKNKKEINLDDLKEMWFDLGIGEEMADRVYSQTEKYMSDKNILEKIQSIYPKMLELAKGYEI